MEMLPTIAKISGKDLQFKRDRETRKAIEQLKKCKNAIDNFSDWVYGELDISASKKRKFAAKILNSLVPERFRDYLPEFVEEFLAEESHASYLMESHLRTNVINTIGVVKNLKASAQYDEEELKKLVGEVDLAEQEGWDARTIKERFTELMNEGAAREAEKILTDGEINEIYDEKFSLLPPKEKEKRRLRLLQRIRHNIASRENLVQADLGALSLALEALEVGEFQLIDFVTVIRPLRVLESAAKDLAELDKSLFVSKDVVIKMAQITAATFGHAADALAQVHAYAISGRDTTEFFRAVSEHIQDKVLKLEETRDKILALEEKRHALLQPPSKPNKEEKIEDAVVVKATA